MLIPHLHTLADYMLPEGDSNLAPQVDMAWKLILFVTGFFFCVVVGAMTYFVFRYRRRTPNDVTSTITHNTPLEIAWTGIPLILVLAFFYVGFRGFLTYDTPPSNCVLVDVEGRQWKFTFTYPNGAQDSNLYLLLNQPVRLNLTSVDVLHAIYLPNFRTQRNLVPGRQTYIWFTPTKEMPDQVVRTDPVTKEIKSIPTDGWPIFCTQYCGDGHSRMFARVYVLNKADYEAKMKELANPFKKKLPSGKNVFLPYAEVGKTLYQQKGCASCHSIDGTLITGPSWKDLWKTEQFFYSENPTSLGGGNMGSIKPSDSDETWEAYIKESILDPEAKLVKTPQGQKLHGMPSFASQLSGTTSNEEMRRAIVSFIKSIGNTNWKPETNPTDNPELYDADKSPLVDEQGVPVHPESALGLELLKKRNSTQSRPASPAGN